MADASLQSLLESCPLGASAVVSQTVKTIAIKNNLVTQGVVKQQKGVRLSFVRNS